MMVRSVSSLVRDSLLECAVSRLDLQLHWAINDRRPGLTKGQRKHGVVCQSVRDLAGNDTLVHDAEMVVGVRPALKVNEAEYSWE